MPIITPHLSSNSVGSFRFVCLSAQSMEKLESSVRGQSFAVYSFDANDVRDKYTMIDQLSKSFHVEPSYIGNTKSWDVICDLMWQSINSQPGNKIILLIYNADALIRNCMQLLLDTIEVLDSFGRTLEEVSPGSRSIVFRVALIGKEYGFPDWREEQHDKGIAPRSSREEDVK
jgi:hypothetical protein